MTTDPTPQPEACPSCGAPDRFTVRPPCSLDQYDPDSWHSWGQTRPAAERQPTPADRPQPDHGAAGFCTDHANSKPAPSSAKAWSNAPDERTETVARVLREHQRCRCCEGCGGCLSIDVPIDQHQAAAVVAALDDAIVPATDDAACPRCGCPTACPEGVVDALTVQRDAARAALDRVRSLHPRGETWLPPGEGEVTTADDHISDGCQACQVPWPCMTSAALDPEEPR